MTYFAVSKSLRTHVFPFSAKMPLQKHAFIISSKFAFLILPERNNNFLNNEFNFRMVVLIFCKVCTMCWSGFDIICGKGIVILAYETSNLGTHPSQNMQWIIQASQISKSLRGRAIPLLAWTVFRSPCSKDVLAIWNSSVFGLEMWTAGMSSIFFLIFAPTSSLEHSEKVNA